MAHGIAINPHNGNVYIGDREEYRIVVYDSNGKFIKTIQMQNLVCALFVDRSKQLWMATGQDGQVVKLDWDGKILGAAGEGPGTGPGQFIESNYMVQDIHGNIFVGDTSSTRVTELVAPKK
jgi:ligand-binding sensor domain-containing protein